MAFRWKRFSILGIALAIPVVVFLARYISEEQVTAFEAHKESLEACKKCHKLFAHFPVRLMMHLEDEHNMTEWQAMKLVEDMYSRLKAARYLKKEKN